MLYEDVYAFQIRYTPDCLIANVSPLRILGSRAQKLFLYIEHTVEHVQCLQSGRAEQIWRKIALIIFRFVVIWIAMLVDSMRSGLKFCVDSWSRKVERTIRDPFFENFIFDPDAASFSGGAFRVPTAMGPLLGWPWTYKLLMRICNGFMRCLQGSYSLFLSP